MQKINQEIFTVRDQVEDDSYKFIIYKYPNCFSFTHIIITFPWILQAQALKCQ